MESSNFERLLQLAEEVFDVGNDSSQLEVNQEVLMRLSLIHPASVSQHSVAEGPVAWLLVIPSTIELMNKFISGLITERELFELTPVGVQYEALYLCSALVLEEHRRKGITKKLALNAIEAIRKTHPLKFLFSWAFSSEGDFTCETISWVTGLPLKKRIGRK